MQTQYLTVFIYAFRNLKIGLLVFLSKQYAFYGFCVYIFFHDVYRYQRLHFYLELGRNCSMLFDLYVDLSRNPIGNLSASGSKERTLVLSLMSR